MKKIIKSDNIQNMIILKNKTLNCNLYFGCNLQVLIETNCI